MRIEPTSYFYLKPKELCTPYAIKRIKLQILENLKIEDYAG